MPRPLERLKAIDQYLAGLVRARNTNQVTIDALTAENTKLTERINDALETRVQVLRAARRRDGLA